MEHSKHFRGYTASTEESTRSQPDYREQIDIGEELPALQLNQDDPIWFNLHGQTNGRNLYLNLNLRHLRGKVKCEPLQ
ncbi:hypothetical protein J4731_03525 [Providencia rettgeri]|nr:hypothetical protein [Providencia rettgeri]